MRRICGSKFLLFLALLLSFTTHPPQSLAQSETNSGMNSNSGSHLSLERPEDWPSPVMDNEIHSFFLADLLEYNPSGTAGALEWDLLGWVGGDYHRIWLRSEGTQRGRLSDGGIGDIELLYGRMISAFFDLQAGIAHERLWGQGRQASRFQGVLSLEGLAPYSFEVEPALFVSQKGDISARFTASQDFLLTQRTIMQLRIETNAAIQEVEEFGVGSGFNDLSLGLRLRYEFRREVAPYVGLTWNTQFGEEAQFQQSGGPEVSGLALVGGVRAWF